MLVVCWSLLVHDADDDFDAAAVNLDGNKLSSYVQKVNQHYRKCKKNNNQNVTSINLNVLCGTSVECERLFSAAKNILTDTRKKISPAVFQALLLIKVNRKGWNVYTVGIMNSIMKKRGISYCNSISDSPYAVHFSTQYQCPLLRYQRYISTVHCCTGKSMLVPSSIYCTTPINWWILKTPITPLCKKPVFGVNLCLDVKKTTTILTARRSQY